jgi:DNA-3-methyladenine glycosylase I
MKSTCAWAKSHPLLLKYHDEEWGMPVHVDARHYEHLVMEAAQAGLSWLTVLKRREAYKKAFKDFDAGKVAKFTEKDVERLMQNPGLIRNRQKLEAAVKNAKAFLLVKKEFGSFDAYIWTFTKGRQIKNNIKTMKDIPAQTELSQKISKDLKARGFTFVGPTTIYAHMQSLGIVNDHEMTCHRRKKCET